MKVFKIGCLIWIIAPIILSLSSMVYVYAIVSHVFK